MKPLRIWGEAPYKAAVVHGGPGSAGALGPLARELSKSVGVLEPLQTKKSIDGQIKELAAILKKSAVIPVVLIGHSWGAILSYLTAARYLNLVKKLILVGIPPPAAREPLALTPVWLERLTEAERVELISIENSLGDGSAEDKSELMGRFFKLTARADSYDPLPLEDEVLAYSLDINIAVGGEMRKLIASGTLLGLGKRITCPVVAICGREDPRPADEVRQSLSGVLKDFKFILLEKCGHYPWMERFARERFFKILREEIS